MKRKFTAMQIGVIAIITTMAIILLEKTMTNKNFYELTEPMLISNNMGSPYYMIPKNTVLTFQRGFPEGHQSYTMEIFYKGDLPATKLSNTDSTESTWLYKIDSDEISKVLQQYPLSKDDLKTILKARKITRDELAQIVREWKDE